MERNPLIAIVMATMIEAKPFIRGMSLKEYEQRPFRLFKNDDILLTISDIGKANAAMGAAYCCQKFKPACWHFSMTMLGEYISAMLITRIFEPRVLSCKVFA